MLVEEIKEGLAVFHPFYGVGIVDVVCNTLYGLVVDVQFDGFFVEFSEGFGEEISELEPYDWKG